MPRMPEVVEIDPVTGPGGGGSPEGDRRPRARDRVTRQRSGPGGAGEG